MRITTAPIKLTASVDVEVFGALVIRGGGPTGGGLAGVSAMSDINGQ